MSRGALQTSRFPPWRPSADGVLYPQAYTWFVLMSVLDLVMTWIVLHTGGEELNRLAESVIRRWDLPGLLVYKFGLVAIVLVLCEVIGRARQRTGRRVAWCAAVVTAVPVILAVVQMGMLSWLYWSNPNLVGRVTPRELSTGTYPSAHVMPGYRLRPRQDQADGRRGRRDRAHGHERPRAGRPSGQMAPAVVSPFPGRRSSLDAHYDRGDRLRWARDGYLPVEHGQRRHVPGH